MSRVRDLWLEARIVLVRKMFCRARNKTAMRILCALMYELIGQRSLQQRARMEQQKGLA